MAVPVRVRLKQHIRSPLFERCFRQISILRVTSRRGTVGCYDMLAERYGEHIRCFTLTRTSPKYKLLCFITTKNFLQREERTSF